MKVFRVLAFSLLLLDHSTVVCADLPAPKNPTFHTLNTNFVLKWDWDPEQGSDSSCNISFTVQYLPRFRIKKPEHQQKWNLLCVTSQHHCDFSSAQLHYLSVWMLHLRTQCEKNESDWVQIEFCPDKDANLGPPSAVTLTPMNGLQVAIFDPLSYNNESMRKLLPKMYYLILYWKRGSQTQKPNKLTSPNNLVILPDLESWTWYCVKVRSQDDFYNKTSVFSPIYCKQTDGQVPYWQICLYFLVALGILACLLGLLAYLVKSTFSPLVSLPAHILEKLFEFAGPDTPPLLSSEPEAEYYSEIEIVRTLDPVLDRVNKVILEAHASLSTLEQSTEERSHHSTGDSGIYSTEEGSAKIVASSWSQESGT